VYEADGTTLVKDLHGAASTATKVVWFDPGDPVVSEYWFDSPDLAGAVLAKSQDSNRKGHLSLRIPAQASDTALQTEIQAIKDAFYVTGRLLKIQRGSETARLWPIFRSRLASPFSNEETARSAVLYKQITRWDFDVWLAYSFQGGTTYALA
jgi:hypothetical protein